MASFHLEDVKAIQLARLRHVLLKLQVPIHEPSWYMCYRGFDVAIVSTILRLDCGIVLSFVNYILYT